MCLCRYSAVQALECFQCGDEEVSGVDLEVRLSCLCIVPQRSRCAAKQSALPCRSSATAACCPCACRAATVPLHRAAIALALRSRSFITAACARPFNHVWHLRRSLGLISKLRVITRSRAWPLILRLRCGFIYSLLCCSGPSSCCSPFLSVVMPQFIYPSSRAAAVHATRCSTLA